MQSSLTIGNFDGVHLGHQQLIKRVIELANASGTKPSLLTFEPHPREFLGIRPIPSRICSVEEKLRRIRSLGLENIIIQEFNDAFSNLTAQAFLAWIIKSFNPKHVVVGKNFFFGKNREGNPDLMQAWGEQTGVTLEILEPVLIDNTIISSSEIRRSIKEGEIIRANKLMNFNHRIDCEVVTGDGRGRHLGFPTLNSPLPKQDGKSHLCLPPHGVYITRAHVEEKCFASVTNFGIRPTFHTGTSEEFFETHVLSEWSNRLSFKHLSVEFLDRIRPERRFSSKEQLIEQIQQDIAIAKKFHHL
jgi:riboflavin kinase/FMN adenylyltransferase